MIPEEEKIIICSAALTAKISKILEKLSTMTPEQMVLLAEDMTKADHRLDKGLSKALSQCGSD